MVGWMVVGGGHNTAESTLATALLNAREETKVKNDRNENDVDVIVRVDGVEPAARGERVCRYGVRIPGECVAANAADTALFGCNGTPPRSSEFSGQYVAQKQQNCNGSGS